LQWHAEINKDEIDDIGEREILSQTPAVIVNCGDATGSQVDRKKIFAFMVEYADGIVDYIHEQRAKKRRVHDTFEGLLYNHYMNQQKYTRNPNRPCVKNIPHLSCMYYTDYDIQQCANEDDKICDGIISRSISIIKIRCRIIPHNPLLFDVKNGGGGGNL
jgi:hypothetical protein